MKPIYEWALNQIGADKNGNLMRAISMLNEDVQEQFVEVIIGIDIDTAKLPKKIRRNDVVYTLESANYLKDEIVAKYIGTDTRYFSNEEDASKYAATGYYNYNDSSHKKTDDFPIKGEHTSEHTNWFNYHTWMNSEVVGDIEEDIYG